MLVGPAAEIGDVLVEDERVRLITFTGSSEVGWKLQERAPRKRVKLELGNSTPVIVAADSRRRDRSDEARRECVRVRGPELHLRAAHLRGAPRARRRSSPAFVPKVEALKVGDPADDDTDVEAVIDAGSRERILSWIAEADGGRADRRRAGRADQADGDRERLRATRR